MKIFLAGLDCAAPEYLLEDPQLVNFRRLMAGGCYGRLESVIPPITVPAWMCMATSRDPGSLGVYGFRNRTDHSYGGLKFVNSRSIDAPALWDYAGQAGKKSIIVGVPPSYPPRKIQGICVSCFLTPDSRTNLFASPPQIADQIQEWVGEYPVDVPEFRTDRKDWLLEEIYAMSRKHFTVIRQLMTHHEWDYFQFVEIGLDRIHHGFWKYADPSHRLHEPNSPYQNVIRDYYRYLDQEIGSLLTLLPPDTVVLVASDHGAQRLDGGFCINQWLVQKGWLVLREYPSIITPFDKLAVDWEKTRVWSEGGYYARVFFNVAGREPCGMISPADYPEFREEVKQALENLLTDQGEPMGTLVFRPEEIYREVRNVAPDLIVHLGGLYWRSIGGVGYQKLYTLENDTGPDACNHAQFGGFILNAPRLLARGEIQGFHLLDVAPTLLSLAGYPIPPDMQGRACPYEQGLAGETPQEGRT
jgi:predicted AlkP superfamily phosphohydrolase/phosphomutase